jgi:serine/threonine protein kinase
MVEVKDARGYVRKMTSTNQLGTPATQPDDVLQAMEENRPYDPSAADVWSCGVILFWLVGYNKLFESFQSDFVTHAGGYHHGKQWSSCSGFQRMVSSSDGNPMNLMSLPGGEYDAANKCPPNTRFWQHFEEYGGLVVSPQFKQLFNKMCDRDADRRINMREVVQHEWLRGVGIEDVGGDEGAARFLQEMQSRHHIAETRERKVRIAARSTAEVARKVETAAMEMLGDAVVVTQLPTKSVNNLNLTIREAAAKKSEVGGGGVSRSVGGAGASAGSGVGVGTGVGAASAIGAGCSGLCFTIRVSHEGAGSGSFKMSCKWVAGEWASWIDFMHALERDNR